MRAMSTVNLIDLFRHGWIHLQLAAIIKEDSVNGQSSMDPFRYAWIHLQTALAKEGEGKQEQHCALLEFVRVYRYLYRSQSVEVLDALHLTLLRIGPGTDPSHSIVVVCKI